jgi:hypothetical protein
MSSPECRSKLEIDWSNVDWIGLAQDRNFIARLLVVV